MSHLSPLVSEEELVSTVRAPLFSAAILMDRMSLNPEWLNDHARRLEDDKDAMRKHFGRELQALEAECAKAERRLYLVEVQHRFHF